ncbi:MAG: DUF2281 domain-containing protein [Calditrichaeota bacterium]|nr:MAG: DUF2281 domain-containing protein [Calditrichota bacterium]
MIQDSMLNNFNNLPPEAQKQVMDFIAFLRTRYQKSNYGKNITKTKLTEEPFIGIWRDRDDVQDSSAWVRNIRKNEWK